MKRQLGQNQITACAFTASNESLRKSLRYYKSAIKAGRHITVAAWHRTITHSCSPSEALLRDAKPAKQAHWTF